MATPATGFNFGPQLCEALGLDYQDHKIKSIKIEVESASVALVTIEEYLFEPEAEAIKELVGRYHLVPADGE